MAVASAIQIDNTIQQPQIWLTSYFARSISTLFETSSAISCIYLKRWCDYFCSTKVASREIATTYFTLWFRTSTFREAQPRGLKKSEIVWNQYAHVPTHEPLLTHIFNFKHQLFDKLLNQWIKYWVNRWINK